MGRASTLVAYFSWAENAVLSEDVDAITSPSVVPPGNVQRLAAWVQEATGGGPLLHPGHRPLPQRLGCMPGPGQPGAGEDARPALTAAVEDLDQYDTVFLGYPNWWYGVPMAVLTFLEENDLSGKQVYLFCSHGTGGWPTAWRSSPRPCPTPPSQTTSLTAARRKPPNPSRPSKPGWPGWETELPPTKKEALHMRIVILESSPNRHGSSNLLAERFAQGAQEAGHQVAFVDVAHADIHPCTGCVHCGYEGPCVQKDDVEGIRRQLLAADMVVFVTPLYYYGMSAQLKTMVDRFCAFNSEPAGQALEVRPCWPPPGTAIPGPSPPWRPTTRPWSAT